MLIPIWDRHTWDWHAQTNQRNPLISLQASYLFIFSSMHTVLWLFPFAFAALVTVYIVQQGVHLMEDEELWQHTSAAERRLAVKTVSSRGVTTTHPQICHVSFSVQCFCGSCGPLPDMTRYCLSSLCCIHCQICGG